MKMVNRILNLTEFRRPIGADINFEFLKFNGGEPHIKIKNSKSLENAENIYIICNLNTAYDLLKLGVAVSAIRNTDFKGKLNLTLGYFPGGRQDRVANEGEAFTLKVYTDIINLWKFDEVRIHDPHSDVTPALVNNSKVKKNYLLVYFSLLKLNYKKQEFNLISPDAGATKKIILLAKYLSEQSFKFNIIECSKIRDTKTGKLTGFKVNADSLNNLPSIIVDDICDGGGTFLGLADELKEKRSGDLSLIVTHGIFSKGFKSLEKKFKNIFTSNSFGEERFYNSFESYEQGQKIKNLTIIQ